MNFIEWLRLSEAFDSVSLKFVAFFFANDCIPIIIFILVLICLVSVCVFCKKSFAISVFSISGIILMSISLAFALILSLASVKPNPERYKFHWDIEYGKPSDIEKEQYNYNVIKSMAHAKNYLKDNKKSLSPIVINAIEYCSRLDMSHKDIATFNGYVRIFECLADFQNNIEKENLQKLNESIIQQHGL